MTLHSVESGGLELRVREQSEGCPAVALVTEASGALAELLPAGTPHAPGDVASALQAVLTG